MAFTIWNDSKSKRRVNLILIEEIYEFVCDEYSKLEKAYSIAVSLLVGDILRAVTEKMLQTDILYVCNQSGFESRNFNRFSAFIWYTWGDVHFISDILRFNNSWTNKPKDIKFWRLDLDLYYWWYRIGLYPEHFHSWK